MTTKYLLIDDQPSGESYAAKLERATHGLKVDMVEEREPINIDKDNFNEVLKAQNLKLDITIPNKLSEDPEEEMSLALKFESLADFGPEAIVKNTPELNKLLELREALNSLKGPMSNRPEFRKKIQELIKDEAAREQLLKELKLEE